jgi:hypothetical protein
MLDTGADWVAPDVTSEPSWPTLRAHLLVRAAETGEHPLLQLLNGANSRPGWTRPPCSIGASPTPRPLTPGPLPWLPGVPNAFLDHPVWDEYNERQVGEAVRSSGLDRSEVFLETKIWISDYGYDKTLHGFDKSARKLGVDQIDLLILHQALPSDFEATLQAYRALETLLADGGGTSHRGQQLHGRVPHHAARARYRGAGSQPDRGPPLLPAETSAGPRCRTRHPDSGLVPDRRHHLLPRRAARQHPSGPIIGDIAKTQGKTPAQVMLRWHLQQDRSVIPKSTKPQRIAENIAVFDFELSAEELAAIDALDTGQRVAPSLSRSHWRTPGARSPRTRGSGFAPEVTSRIPKNRRIAATWPHRASASYNGRQARHP